MSICIGCMNEKGDSKECPHCGYVENAQPKNPVYLNPGTVLNNRFIIGSVIAQGGFGITYIGYDNTLKQKIAIKEYYPLNFVQRKEILVIPYSESVEKEYKRGKARFIEEARNLARFSELPGVAGIRDCIEANGTAYIIMQFLDGITLDDYIKQNNNIIPYQSAVKILSPIMDALSRIHKAGIIHREINPDNIFITNDSQVKLIGFSEASLPMGREKNLSILLNTGYTPEEEYRKSGNQGPWTDVYALTATFYRMITGKVPPNPIERLMNDTLIIPDNLPDNVKLALKKGMAIHASERFEKIEDLRSVLLNKEYKPNVKQKTT